MTHRVEYWWGRWKSDDNGDELNVARVAFTDDEMTSLLVMGEHDSPRADWPNFELSERIHPPGRNIIRVPGADVTRLVSDAHSLAAYAVNLARGNTFEPQEFDNLSEIAGRRGMATGAEEVARWLEEQNARARNAGMAQQWVENDHWKTRYLLYRSRPWWKRLFG